MQLANNRIYTLAQFLRYLILTSTSRAGSGHVSSCFSAADIMAGLWHSGLFRYTVEHPESPYNDKLIFSKGHAAPLLYALWAVAGALPVQDLFTLRSFGSPLEGHPTLAFAHTLVPTGSLGMGLSYGAGMAYHHQYVTHTDVRSHVLLGDSELAEGQVWEAIQFAGYYQLHNLIAYVDYNTLGQQTHTMWHGAEDIASKYKVFGWHTIQIDGHDPDQIALAIQQIAHTRSAPLAIIGQTIKGKGIPWMENKIQWHGKVVSESQLSDAIAALGQIDTSIRISLPTPSLYNYTRYQTVPEIKPKAYPDDHIYATRQAVGDAIRDICATDTHTIVVDAEVGNSTYLAETQGVIGDRYIQSYIAEQNMVSISHGIATQQTHVFCGSFGAFLSRAHDQLRIAGYANPALTVIGSHAGCSIGADGSSQMALEDIAMMRALNKSIVLYPADAHAAYVLTHAAYQTEGLSYIRTTRETLPLIYRKHEQFPIGKSKIHRLGDKRKKYSYIIVAAGITLHEALRAQHILFEQGINGIVFDAYSVKPFDNDRLIQIAHYAQHIVVVEDHFPAGGIGEVVSATLAHNQWVGLYTHLAVYRTPRSGTPRELLAYTCIDTEAIVRALCQKKRIAVINGDIPMSS